MPTCSKSARSFGGDCILTMDSEGQHDPDDIQKFKALAGNDDVHLVVGERLDTGAVPLKSRIGHQVATALFLRVLARMETPSH